MKHEQRQSKTSGHAATPAKTFFTPAARLSRRTVLKGLGAAVGLPLLEAMQPTYLRAAGSAAEPEHINRMAFLYVPNGVHVPDWTPATEGADYALPYILEPLATHRAQMTVLTGLAQDLARPHGDGPGDHARAQAAFLTGCHPHKTSGANIRVGVSVDQVAAQKVGHRTRFPSLELGCEPGLQAGNCDSGYSCAYSSNLSWRTPTMPLAKEVDPRLVFERLFGTDGQEATPEARARRRRYERSILDLVREDAGSLERQLGQSDRRKLDEYLSAVREVETRIVNAERQKPVDLGNLTKPTAIPKKYSDHLRVMIDLLALAFQADLTRVATFFFANDGSNRSYKEIGVAEGHHDLSHHGRKADKQAKIRQINRFHTTQLAYFLDKLAGTREGNGTVLDNSMIVYGSGISDGDAHNHDNLPVLLLGGGAGTIRSGRHLRHAQETPLNNLYLSLLDRMDAKLEDLGDSNGRVELWDA